jgi:hypothetical protein
MKGEMDLMGSKPPTSTALRSLEDMSITSICQIPAQGAQSVPANSTIP